MVRKTLVALALSGAVLGHSAVPMVKGDVAGSTTALGIDPSIPVVNKNKNVIEPDANTMPSRRDARANGLGTLNAKTKVTMDMLPQAVQNGGSGQVPQVSNTIQVTYRQMVIDGRFDPARGATVLIDPTATGNFQNAVEAQVQQAPDIVKQASIDGTTVVGKDMPMTVAMPAGLTCTGPQNTCLVRVVNGRNEGNQLWGGHFPIQQVPAAGAQPAAGAAPAAGSPAGAKRALAVRGIHVRDGGVAALAEQLKKIAVRDTTEPDIIARADEPHNPTYEDMLAWEAANPI